MTPGLASAPGLTFILADAMEPSLSTLAAAQTSSPFVTAVVVFVLAIFIGFFVIAKVPSTLHTPLMSGSNAISGITLVGAMLCAFSDSVRPLAVWLGFFAMIFATINVVGGYLVTDRMLRMFRGEKKEGGK